MPAIHLRTARLLAGLVAVVAFVAAFAGPLRAAEEIQSFNAAVAVLDNGTLAVTETIRVRAEGNQIKRGIFRDFPLTFVDDAGRTHRVSFRLTGVTRDGKPEPYHTNSNSEGLRIYIGKEDVFLPDGVYTYVIHYETGRQIRFFPDHTELFWNVTGNDWDFPILRASTVIRLPGGKTPVRWTAFTGRYGERGTAFTGQVRDDNALVVSTTGTLRAGEGLSVAVEIPPGLVAPPSGMQALIYWVSDNKRYVLGGFGFLGVLLFYLITWNAVGRDPPKGVIIPLFHAPDGISPALTSYIHKWGWSGGGWRAFTAATLSLAVKGLLVFDDSGPDIVLTRTDKGRGGSKGLPPGERSILDWLNGRGGQVTINSASGKSVETALKVFRAAVEAENRDRFFRRNAGYVIVGAALTVLSMAAVLVFGDLTENEIGLLFFVAFGSIFVGAFLVPVIRSLFGQRSVKSIVGIGLNLVVLLFIGGTFLSIVSSSFQSLPNDFGRSLISSVLANGFPFALVGGFATMNGLFYYLLRAPTAAGRKVMDELEGLELYIRTAETARLNAQGAPDLDTTQFERILPYAVALEAEKPWSEAFAAAFARAHPGEEATLAYAPGWHGGSGWSGRSLGSAIASSVSSATGSFASSVPAPSSSSSGFSGGGGGGGSGGGGGGGGGGGW